MSFATSLTLDLQTKCLLLPEFKNKAIIVYSVDNLLETIKQVRPAVGILYEGARSIITGSPHDSTLKVGASSEAIFSLLIVCETSVLSSLVDAKTPAHELLDSLRLAIQGTRNPTGHRWKWMLEAPAVQKGVVTVWVQRWGSPVQTVPAPNAPTK